MNSLTVGSLLLLALPAFAQDDRIVQTNGETIENVKVTAFEITEVRYQKGGGNQSLSTDRVSKIVLAKYADVYKRGIANSDPGLFTTSARERLTAKDPLLAQFGFVAAANLYLSYGKDEDVKNAFANLEEMQKAIPNAGLLPELYRAKFDYYAGKGDFNNALLVARRFQSDATTGAWPQGFQLEGEFLVILGEGGIKGDKDAFQGRLRDLLSRVEGAYPQLANRAKVQLADSMRESGKKDEARKIYDDLVARDGVDANSRASALLGIGYLEFAKGDPGNREPFKDALLDFLRVHLLTKDAYDVLHAEALYNAALAAQRWQGADWQYIMGRCKWMVTNDARYSGSRWAEMAKKM